MSTKIENRLANVVCQALTLRRKLHPQSTAMLMAYFEGEVLEMRAAFAAFQGLMPGTELIEMFQVMHGIGAEGATHRLDNLHTSLNIIVSESMPALAIEFSPHVIDVKGWVDEQAELYNSLMKNIRRRRRLSEPCTTIARYGRAIFRPVPDHIWELR